MSFSDLERGQGPSQQNQTSQGDFDALANKVSLQIFKINGNTTGMGKLVDLIGTPRDTPAIRKKLHDLTEVTRDIIKGSPEDLKALMAHQTDTRQQKIEQAKVSRDFQTAVASFQQMQQKSAKQQRTHVKAAVSELAESQQQHQSSTQPIRQPYQDHEVELEEQRPAQSQQQQGQQQLQTQVEAVPDSEVEYQEQLIEEREHEIRGIEAGIHELNDIFRDLGTIVHEQQSMLDNIETNVNSIATDTERASDELTTAHRYQRKRGKRMCYLLMIFVVVLVVVLSAALA